MRATIDRQGRELDIDLSAEEVQRFVVGNSHAAGALREACRDAGCLVAFMWSPRGDLVASVELPR